MTVSCCRLDDDRDIALADAVAMLAPSERARQDRFVYRRDGDRFVRGRGFLRRSVGDRLDRDPATLRIDAPPGRKPVFPGSGIDANLSHSEDFAVVAISDKCRVGIDLEQIGRSLGHAEDVASLARQCMRPHECAVLDRVAPDDRVERFLLFWTAKEARMKVYGEGMALDPKDIDLRLEDGRPVAYRDFASRHIRLKAIALPELGAICHVATAPSAGAGETSVANVSGTRS